MKLAHILLAAVLIALANAPSPNQPVAEVKQPEVSSAAPCDRTCKPDSTAGRLDSISTVPSDTLLPIV